MKIKQISVFLENKKGRLYQALKVLGDNDINIRALAIADTSEFGILRMIVDKPEEAKSALEKEGFTTRLNNVIVVEVKDQPGGLAQVLYYLYEGDINIEYVYAFVEKSGENALVVLRTNNLDKTIDILKENSVSILSWEDILSL